MSLIIDKKNVVFGFDSWISHPLLKAGWDLPKIEALVCMCVSGARGGEEVTKSFTRKGDKPEKGGDVKIAG